MNEICKINYNTYSVNYNPADVTNAFINEYYKNSSNKGWNSIQNLFCTTCTTVLQNKHVGNEYDLLYIFLNSQIKRSNYDDLNIKWFSLPNNTIFVTVFGKMQFVSFKDELSPILHFVESFILNVGIHNNIYCTYHILDL